MGAADQALQHTLLRKYLLLLQENNTLPGAICFYTSGVKMVVEGSPVLDVLQSLEAQRRSLDCLQDVPRLLRLG